MPATKNIEGICGKLINDQYQYRTLCLGIDQAYGDTGIALAGIDRKGNIDIITCGSVAPLPNQLKVEYRASVCQAIQRIVKKYRCYGDEFFAVCESVRVHTEGAVSIRNHLNWGALQGSMHDCLYNLHGITLRTVDTRAWKSAVVGTSKPALKAPRGVDPKKWPTIQCIMYKYDISKQKLTKVMTPRSKSYTWVDENGNKCTYNSDISDACGIAIYGLVRPLNKLQMAP